jgi:hypothetical protein
MHSSPTARLARAWGQAQSKLHELGVHLFPVDGAREPAVQLAVVKTSDGCSRSVRYSGHPTVLERRSP